MQLSMTVLRCPDKVVPEARTVPGGEFHVGRGPDVDWVLPDPERLLSKRHFAVAFRSGAWHVADTSTNGTFLNTDPNAIGKGVTRLLRDGDRLRLGAYEIETRLVDQPAMGGGFGQGNVNQGGPGAAAGGDGPFGDPFGDHPFAPAPPPRDPFGQAPYTPPAVTLGSTLPPDDFDLLAPHPAHRGGIPDDFHGASFLSDQPSRAHGTSPAASTPGGVLFPDDFDPMTPAHAQDHFRGPVQADHSSPLQDAVRDPPQSPAHPPVTPPSGGPSFDDRWDKVLGDFGSPAAASRPAPAPMDETTPSIPSPTPFPPAAPPEMELETIPPRARADTSATPFPDASPDLATPSPTPATMAPPVVRQRPARPQQPPSDPAPLSDPFAGAAAAPSQASPFPPAAVSSQAPFPFAPGPTPGSSIGSSPGPSPGSPSEASPFGESDASPLKSPVAALALPAKAQPAPMPISTPASVPPASVDEALAAFLEGAGLAGAHPANGLAMMKALGASFRAMVAGLRAVLIARASIKNEFRIEQTMIRARGNNPLKFAADDQDALTALLGVGRRTDMTPAAAVEDALRDLRLHEVATMAAMQVAVRSMMDEISPEKIRASTEQGGMTLLAAQKKARAWDVFESRHAATVQAMSDDFDSVFGKSFARAYERALAEMAARKS